MPVGPRTWGTGDPVSATYLNNDLYTYAGSYFIPSGVRFHARKPVYKSAPNAAISVPSKTWDGAYQGVGATTIIDSSADYGIQMDPALWGAVESVTNAADGNPPSTGGGWYLLWGFSQLSAYGTAGTVAAASLAKNGATHTVDGSYQRGNAARTSGPFVMDLVSMGTDSWTLAAYNGSGTAVATTASGSDASGDACRLHALWASASTTAPSTPSAPAPKQSWGTADAWTSGFANGTAGVRDVLRYLTWPPVFRAHDNSGQVVTANTNGTMSLGTVDVDTYGGFTGGTTYTVQRPGLYLCHGYVPWQSYTGHTQAGLNVNGTVFWGPATVTPTDGNGSGVTKTQIFSLNANDTVQLIGWNNANGTASTGSSQPRLVMSWLSGAGVPSPLPNVPDTTYRYLAGTPVGTVQSVFNAHLANDLTFLTYRPYLMAYQGTAQAGFAQSSQSQVTMDTVGGIVHGDNGDNYSGWSSSNHNYVAPRSGWYVACSEIMMALPSLTVSPTLGGLFQVSNNSPAQPWDSYQYLMCSFSVGCAGATAASLYYLRAGDTITPGVGVYSTAAGTVSTNVSSGRQSHFECVFVSE